MFSIRQITTTNNAGRIPSSFVLQLAIMAVTFAMILAPSTASARRSPPTPQNFHVTAQTAYTITVAWNPPGNNSGEFEYHLSGAYGVTPAVLPKTATSYTFTRLHSGNQYWLFIYAKDSNGNTSGTANTTTRTLLDTTPPTTGPSVTVTDVGSNYISLSWTAAQDDCPFLSYQVSVNGEPFTEPSPNMSAMLRFLQPQTSYTLTVRGRDEGRFWSPFSAPVTVTTLPPNPNDHTPPTTPANLSAYSIDGFTELQIQWTQSTDDFDAQANIRYDVYINGVFEDVLFGSGGPIPDYGVLGDNTIEVIATDTAGNASPPATATIHLP